MIGSWCALQVSAAWSFGASFFARGSYAHRVWENRRTPVAAWSNLIRFIHVQSDVVGDKPAVQTKKDRFSLAGGKIKEGVPSVARGSPWKTACDLEGRNYRMLYVEDALPVNL